MEEKKYEEALKRAKLAIEECGDNVGRIKMIESIFPELAESKEENIRKSILMMFKKALPDVFNRYGMYKNDAIAYMEKLKDIDKRLEDAYKTADEVQYKRGYDDGYLEGIVHAKEELEKQGKPEDMGEVSDGYHTFNELYYYRMLYNAAFFNMLPEDWVHKSKRHHDGEECFGGGWFIVMANLPTGQISNHYELKDWDLFQIPEKDIADEWDGHTPQQAAERLHKFLLEKQGEQEQLTHSQVTKKSEHEGVEQGKREMLENALDAYCKVCSNYGSPTPLNICRQECKNYSDFKKAMEDKEL